MGAMELEENTVQIRDDFDPDKILESGQCFRPRKQAEGWYRFVSGRQLLYLRPLRSGTYTVRCEPGAWETFWHGYFDLGRSYAALRGKLDSRDDFLQRAMEYGRGIRVLRQDRWEALCSFIISQNNNIKRIRGIVETLCDTWGEPLPGGRSSFPGPEVLASLTEEDLQPLRSGFRAKYILDAARKTASGEVDLDHVASLPTEEAAAELCRIRGVGIKVAHCALLYGFHRIECLPVDVWMKRVMSTMYPQGLPEELLPYAGIAQQYLFHYSRSHPELFEA